MVMWIIQTRGIGKELIMVLHDGDIGIHLGILDMQANVIGRVYQTTLLKLIFLSIHFNFQHQWNQRT